MEILWAHTALGPIPAYAGMTRFFKFTKYEHRPRREEIKQKNMGRLPHALKNIANNYY